MMEEGLSNKSPKIKITPARACSDGGEIVKIGLVRQSLFFCDSSHRNSSDPAIAGCRLTTGYLAVRISDLFARPSGPLNSQPRRLCRRAQLADDSDRRANSSPGGERYYSLTTGMRS